MKLSSLSLPVGEFAEGIIKILTCGPTGLLINWEQPSLTTSLLATGAAMAWMAACALDVSEGPESSWRGTAARAR